MCGSRVLPHTQYRSDEHISNSLGSGNEEGEKKFNLLINVIKLTEKKHQRAQSSHSSRIHEILVWYEMFSRWILYGSDVTLDSEMDNVRE